MDRAKAHTKTAHNNKPCCTAPAAAACCCRSPWRRWKMRLPRRGSHASDAPKCGASPGGVGDVIGAMRVPQCHCCGGAAPGEILALEAVFDAIFSRGFCSSARALAALLGNATELERFRGVLRCAVDGKAPKSTPSWSYLASVRCGGYSTPPGRWASPKGALFSRCISAQSQRPREKKCGNVAGRLPR